MYKIVNAIVSITVPGEMNLIQDITLIKELQDVLDELGISYKICKGIPGWFNQHIEWLQFKCKVSTLGDSISFELKYNDDDQQEVIEDVMEALKWGALIMHVDVVGNHNQTYPFRAFEKL